jgi:hypothetical protein
MLSENNPKLHDKLLELRGLFHASLYFKLFAREGCLNTVESKEQSYRATGYTSASARLARNIGGLYFLRRR